MTSYVYRIGFPSGHYYIGVKKGTPKTTKNYVGSPKRNKWMWDEFPVVCKEILWVTDTFERAMEVETSTLLGLDYADDPLCLNASHWINCLTLVGENSPAFGKVWANDGTNEAYFDGSCIPNGWEVGRVSKPTITCEERQARSERMTGDNNPAKRPEVRAKLSASSNKKGENNPRFGVTLSDEIKNKITEGNRNSQDYTCPHCEKTMKAGNYKRWHGDNCKMKRD